MADTKSPMPGFKGASVTANATANPVGSDAGDTQHQSDSSLGGGSGNAPSTKQSIFGYTHKGGK